MKLLIEVNRAFPAQTEVDHLEQLAKQVSQAFSG